SMAVLTAIAATVWYTTDAALRPLAPSGRTSTGVWLGVLGTLAMVIAGLYGWRRRQIERASRPILISPEKRRDLMSRERAAQSELRAIEKSLIQNPKQNLRKLRGDVNKVLEQHKVKRTIRVRVVTPAGAVPRLVVERREWGGRLQVWYEWHLALGVLAVVLILLHAGFRFANPIAAIAFALLVAVVLTGLLGVVLYRRIPPRLTEIEERAARTPEELRDELAQVLDQLKGLSAGKSESFRRVYDVEMSIPGISMKPSLKWIWGSSTIERDTSRPDRLRLVVKEIPPTEQEDFRKAMRFVFEKEKLEVSLYPQIRYDYLLKVWLTAHIPLSAGLAAFSLIHIVSVFYY
ncbi:MAG: hypothetical protein ACREQJ_08805, partial [Candidatus Binatia bacterium]